MYKLDLYIDGQRADLFGDESVEMTLTTQNVNDLGAVYGDYSRSFTLPATKVNNAIFKHYYNVDIYGGFTAALRTDAIIDVNKNFFREGSIELTSVELKNNEPYSYMVSFYTSTTSLKDLFGEDTLNGLDLSALDHSYNDTNIAAGIDGYVSGTSSSVIYPMITPVTRWFYNSQGGVNDPGNIHYHNDIRHGAFWYDFKPAVKLTKIIDAIEAKYGIEFESDLFASSDFGRLFMWCHRRAGYMFKDQPNGFTAQKIDFTAADNSNFDLTNDTCTINNSSWVNAAGQHIIYYNYVITSTDTYKIQAFVNGQLQTTRTHTGNANQNVFLGELQFGDVIDFRISPPDDWDASAISISNLDFDIRYFDGIQRHITNPTRTASLSLSKTVEISDQLPEQKIVDFIGSLIRSHNLVVVRSANGKYKMEPLDQWYYEGTTHDITDYVDTNSVTINRPELYRRISFKYNENKSVLGETYRLQNDIGYGDLRADFTFDGPEFNIEVGFDNMLFERLSDQYSSGVGLTPINVGQAVTREEKPYIGKPIVFYVNDVISISTTYHWQYIDMNTSANQKTNMWLISNVNANTAEDVTKTLNFGTEIDPYLLQGFSAGLSETYWKTYITELYSQSRRLFRYSAQLPLGLMLTLKNNDKLTILERNYIINSINLDLNTGAATLELLNDMGIGDPTSFSEALAEDGSYLTTEAGDYITIE